MATEHRLQQLPRPARSAARWVLRVITLSYRLRYGRRLRCGRDVVILGGLRIMQGTTLVLGDRTRVRRAVVVNGGGVVTVGADTLLNGCWIGAATKVSIGDRCLVSDCFITDNDFHNLEPWLRHEPPGQRTRSPIRIEDNVWVGAQAWVLKGSSIGRDSVISAATVVRGEVPPGVVVVGNPAVVVKHLAAEPSAAPEPAEQP